MTQIPVILAKMSLKFSTLQSFLLCMTLAQQQDESDAVILRFENLVDQSGAFEYAYETSNGIVEEAEGEGGKYTKGFFQYTSPEGLPVRISYIADAANGFQPTGNVIPQPHPAVAKAIEYIRSLNPQ